MELKDRVYYGDYAEKLGTVVEVVGQLIGVQWDEFTYPYKDHNYPRGIKCHAYLARQLTLASRNEERQFSS